MRPEWQDRLNHWIATLEKEFYEPLGSVTLEAFTTYDMLSPAEAEQQTFSPAPVGMPWGRTWEYGWFRGDIVLDERAVGKLVVMDIRTGGEATVFVNGQAFGTRRAEWVKQPHHYICDQLLTENAQAGDRFHLLLAVMIIPNLPSGPWPPALCAMAIMSLCRKMRHARSTA